MRTSGITHEQSEHAKHDSCMQKTAIRIHLSPPRMQRPVPPVVELGRNLFDRFRAEAFVEVEPVQRHTLLSSHAATSTCVRAERL